jgi:LysR family transcriptional regulator, regulator of abg operon
MKFHQMRDFLAVAEAGSLRSASRRLGITQPAITRSIRELERDLGVALFDRQTSGVTLTGSGETLVRRARVISTELARAREEIEFQKGVSGGKVSVGIAHAAGFLFFPKLFPGLRRRFPDAMIEVHECDPQVAGQGLRDGLTDFYIGPLASRESSGLHCDELFTCELVAVGRKGHPLAMTEDFRDLAQERWIANSAADAAACADYFERLGMAAPSRQTQSSSLFALVAEIAESDSMTLLPAPLLDAPQIASTVSRFSNLSTVPGPVICAVRTGGLSLPPLADHLLDLVRSLAINVFP